jgi:hypothetical protein
MNTSRSIGLALLAICLSSASVVSASVDSTRTQVPFIPTSRLFNVSTAEVLRSLDICLSGGGAFSAESEHNFLGRAAIGLGDVAEVEISTLAVLNSLKRSSSSVPTSAFKMRIFGEKGNRPAMAWVLRGTTAWRGVSGSAAGVEYDTRLTRLQVVATKTIGNVALHAGGGWADIRVKDPGGRGRERRWEGEMKRNIFSPLAGFSVQVNPRTTVMGEVEVVPRYDFGEGLTQADDMILSAWSGVMGVRFYFTRWLSTDAGVSYRSDFVGLADSMIRASASVLLPLGESGLRWRWN